MKIDEKTAIQSPELRDVRSAIKRASQAARQVAIQTGTDLIVLKNGVITRISSEELLKEVDRL